MRYNKDEYKDGKLHNGYDYKSQCWVLNGLVQRCGHPKDMECSCYGRLHQGEQTTAKIEELLDNPTIQCTKCLATLPSEAPICACGWKEE